MESSGQSTEGTGCDGGRLWGGWGTRLDLGKEKERFLLVLEGSHLKWRAGLAIFLGLCLL